MIGGFFTAMFSGHLYVIAIVTGLQIVSFKEVIAIANVPSKAKDLRFTRSLNWYFLGTTMYFLYGESVIYYFKHIVLVDKVLLPFATHHRFISFMLYVIGEFCRQLCIAKKVLGTRAADRKENRLCLLRWFSEKGALPFPIHPICLDSHGALSYRRSGPFHHEQHFRRHDLVVSPSSLSNHERHLRLHMRHSLWPYTTNQAIT